MELDSRMRKATPIEDSNPPTLEHSHLRWNNGFGRQANVQPCPGFPMPRPSAGIAVLRVPSASLLHMAGLRKDDCIIAVNGDPVSDELDLRFLTASPEFQLQIMRNERSLILPVSRIPGSFLDIEVVQKPIRRCANKCIFCFIDQMPRGLRSRLYVKDEDLTYSFLNGNYVTLTTATDLQRIVRLGLSPLFISVHATDPGVRRTMLGNRQAPPIMEQLRFLSQNNIGFHTQIVVCPGYTDGPVLQKTIKELLAIGRNLLSIAVVPVGLTKFRILPLRPVDRAIAAEICSMVGWQSDRDRQIQGKRRVFLADEFLLKAGLSIPPALYYEEYPQIENGVGLLRQLLDDWEAAKRRFKKRKPPAKSPVRQKKYFLATSCSALPFLKTIAVEIEQLRPGVSVTSGPIKNRFFGKSVTVAGLCMARDAIRTIKEAAKTGDGGIDRVLVPAVMFNYAGYTLDGYSATRLAKEAGIPVTVIDAVEELLQL